MAQNDLTNANNRKQQLESELLAVRSELRDQKQQFHDASSRITDLQRQLQDANNDRSRLNDRISGLEKVLKYFEDISEIIFERLSKTSETFCQNLRQELSDFDVVFKETIATLRSTESDLRQQLSTAQNERKMLQNELDDLRRRLGQCELEHKTAHLKIEELTQIRITLIKKIEVLEVEKRSAQAVINETASQRAEIERSLNALERENKELNRNCVNLQQQIAQLEYDSGNRLIELANKQRDERQKLVNSLKVEKTQVERAFQNRDRSYKSRVQQLESQLAMLRDQLNAERMRSRSAATTSLNYVTDVSRVGGSSFSGGLYSSGLSRAAYPQTDSFDYVIGK
ncbi:unnamed protein product [Anisakis simplex]|uniref:Myosin_tail_1 domain-containing protein n=1 Tax=Anisakis simplex TaxID=6269 RepID=A0A0M3KD67_ANISI|nr:unnamed protein product [Anisakis simplex]